MHQVAIYDGAFEVMKARPKMLLTLSLLVTAPMTVLAHLARGDLDRLDLLSAVDGMLVGTSDDATTIFDLVDDRPWGLVAGLGLEMLATFVVGVLVARAVASWYAGDDPSGREVARSVGRRTWPMLGAFAVMLAAQTTGLAVLCIGLVVPLTWFAVLAPVLGVEQLGGRAAVTRSFRLANLGFSRVFGPVIGVIVIDQVVRVALETIPLTLVETFPEPMVEPMQVALAAGVGAVSNVFIAASATLIYLSVRVRSEGLDLELEATDVL